MVEHYLLKTVIREILFQNCNETKITAYMKEIN